MVTALLLAACGPPLPSVTTIHGVQVVAIVTDPPQPEAFDTMNVDVWVADGIGLGTEVLVWLCTPVQGRCLEAGPPEVDGLPLELWTQTGNANPRMTFSTLFWPLLGATVANNVDLPEEFHDGYLVVWALACVPGFCPEIDEVEIGPLPGSDAWNQLAEGLAAPQLWLEDVPLGYASIALKLVPLWRPDEPSNPYLTSFTDETGTTGPPGRNGAPKLTESLDPPRVPAPIEGYPPFRVMLDLSDPDGDQPETRSFVTSGLVTEKVEDSNTRINVLWSPQAADADRSPQLFVVADDHFGGTAVWASDPGPTSDDCSKPLEVELTTPAAPGDAIVAELDSVVGASIAVAGTVQGTGAGRDVVVRVNLRDAASGQLLAENLDDAQTGELDTATCTVPFTTNLARAAALQGTSMCEFGGALVDVQASVVETSVGGVDTILATTTTQAVLHLAPDLPCLDE